MKSVTLNLKKYLVDTSDQPYLNRIGYDTEGRDLYVVPFINSGFDMPLVLNSMPLVLNSINIVSKTGEEKFINDEILYGEGPLIHSSYYYDFDRGLLNGKDSLSEIICLEIEDMMYESMDFSNIFEMNKLLGENYVESILLEQIKFLLLIKDCPGGYKDFLSFISHDMDLDDVIDMGEAKEVKKVSPKELFPEKDD